MSRELDISERIVGLVGDSGEAEVTVFAGPTGLTRFANSYIHQNVAEEQLAVSLKVAARGRVASATTTNAGSEALHRLVATTLEAAALRPVDADWPGVGPVAPIGGPAGSHESVVPVERAAVVADFIAAGDGLLAAGYCETESTRVAFANSAGQRIQSVTTRVTLDGIHQTDTSAGSAHQTAVHFADLDGAAAGAMAASKARRAEHAAELEPGRYEVVLEPNAVATLFTFLAFYGFNGKAVLEDRSFAHVGEQQFDPAIDLWDDAGDSRAIGVRFDAEGTPKRRIPFITAGATRSVALNRRLARQMDSVSTGHAVPGGEGFGALPVNLFVSPGDVSTERMIETVERGLLVTEFNYCRILDPKTQVVTGLTRNGTFLIEHGEIVRPVSNLRFTQSFVEAISPGKVLAVGSDARFGMGEFGPGMVYAPSLRLAEWNFTGGTSG